MATAFLASPVQRGASSPMTTSATIHEAAIPRSLKNSRMHPPDMIGNVKLSNDPRSRKFINICGNMNFNQGRNIPTTSATGPLTRPATTEITNKPNKPNKSPAPVLVSSPPITCISLTPPCHARRYRDLRCGWARRNSKIRERRQHR